MCLKEPSEPAQKAAECRFCVPWLDGRRQLISDYDQKHCMTSWISFCLSAGMFGSHCSHPLHLFEEHLLPLDVWLDATVKYAASTLSDSQINVLFQVALHQLSQPLNQTLLLSV